MEHAVAGLFGDGLYGEVDDVALVEIAGENHHVLDYGKKIKWLGAQMAWFQKWLKDDPTWWDALFPKKHL